MLTSGGFIYYQLSSIVANRQGHRRTQGGDRFFEVVDLASKPVGQISGIQACKFSNLLMLPKYIQQVKISWKKITDYQPQSILNFIYRGSIHLATCGKSDDE